MQTTKDLPPATAVAKPSNRHAMFWEGDGRVFGDETIEFDIPAGVHQDIQLTLSGKGNAGSNQALPATC